MPTDGINEPEQADRLIDKMWHKRAELLWGLAAVILLLTFISPVVLIGAALVIATVATAWIGFHELMTRAKNDEADRPAAPVRPAKPAPPAPGDSQLWRGHHAA